MTTAIKSRTTTRTKPRRPARNTPQRRAERGRSTAAQKAYARRAQRTAAVEHGGPPPALFKLRLPQSRASFVLLMMSLLGAGVALTLWLTTQAIADSYKLDKVRAETAQLSERTERLQREVAREQTVAALDRKARGLGMVPAGDPARILVTESGWKKLIGEPTPAQPQPQPQPQPEPQTQRPPAEESERAETNRDSEREPEQRREQRTERESERDSDQHLAGDR